MKNKYHKSLILIVILVLLITACGKGDEDTKDSADKAPTSAPQSNVNIDTSNPVNVGILSNRSNVQLNAQWGPLMTAMSEELGRLVVLVPLTFNDILVQIDSGALDFAFGNPLAMVQARRITGLEFIATLSYANTGTSFSGVIITRSDSNIETIEDLRGRNVTCVSLESSAGGCFFQIFHVLGQGIDPYTEFASFTETNSQDNVVLAVLNGSADVGFIRTGILESMAASGLINSIDEFRIIDEQDDGFYNPHSTILYPEWAFATLPATDAELVTQVQTFLIGLPSNDPVFEAAGVAGFVEAVDYSDIDTLIETLQLTSFEGN